MVAERSGRALMPPYRLIRHFLPPPMDKALLEWASANEDCFAPTGVGHREHSRVDPAYRQSLGVRDFGPITEVLRRRALEVGPELIQEFGVNPSQIGWVELQLVAHNQGAFFKRHMDTMSGEGWADGGMRILSAVYYLFREPQAFAGGDLRIFAFAAEGEPDSFVDISPEHNTLVAFPAWVSHEVLPIECSSRAFADSRFAVNIWLHASPPPNESAA